MLMYGALVLGIRHTDTQTAIQVIKWEALWKTEAIQSQQKCQFAILTPASHHIEEYSRWKIVPQWYPSGRLCTP